MTSESEYDISVVLPIFNEKGHLKTEIERIRVALDASKYSYELIVVDDGSTDESMSRLITPRRYRLLRFSTLMTGGIACEARVESESESEEGPSQL